MPREATFPAKRAPALPLLDNFSLSLLSRELGVWVVDPELLGLESLLDERIVGREPRVSLAADLPGIGAAAGELKPEFRVVRWLR